MVVPVVMVMYSELVVMTALVAQRPASVVLVAVVLTDAESC